MDWRGIQFDWNQARAFLVTAEEGSFSAAARVLHMTQPTLGRQVYLLEQQFGVSLFERTSRGLQLTDSGYQLLEIVRNMGAAATQLSLSASGQAEQIEGEVCISATEVAAGFVLPPILGKLRQQYPKINIELIATNDTSDLHKREADIALRGYRPTQSDLIARKVIEHRMHLYAHKDYVASLGAVKKPEDLSDAQFIAFDHSDRMIKGLSEYGFQVQTSNFPVVAQDHLVQWELVKQGMGIGFMLELVGDKEPLVERVLPDFAPFNLEVWLVVHRELHTSRRLRIVYDFLAEALAALSD